MTNYPVYDSPKLIDLVLLDIQTQLLKMTWLTNAFGRAQKITDKTTYPAVYKGRGEYFSLLPDHMNTSYSFFMIDDPQTFDWIPNYKGKLEVNFSLIFWFDISKIEPLDERNTEDLKDEILTNLNIGYAHGGIEVTRIYEDAQNIFKGFKLSEVKSQYLMYPYAGFRFEGKLKVKQSC